MALCVGCTQKINSKSSPVSLPGSHSAISPPKEEKKNKKYKYTPLKKHRGYIRILILLGNGSQQADVECELVAIPFVKGKELQRPYEALSWCWGTSKPTAQIFIRKGKGDKKRLAKSVTPDLVSALKALRYQTKDRHLWIDQVCINQDDPLEKNHQVEIMSEIYGRASRVCIWLGDGDESSQMALKFINEEVLQLQNFDELCESEQSSKKWGALLNLMQRPWFSRRWVVQEVALAHRAWVYCGSDKISWKRFAVAVELFVEVETATHRLSEVMKKDPLFYHVPGWFEYVSALGASLLVEATGKLFRDYKPNGPAEIEEDSEDDSDSESDVAEDEESEAEEAEDEEVEDGEASGTTAELLGTSETEVQSPPRQLGQPLLTLEYLVSSLSIFEVTMPHDAVYGLLAIARDTTPLAINKLDRNPLLNDTQEALESYTQRKAYNVDYQQPFADVCQEFVKFCIDHSTDRTRALDIICRPWSPEITVGNSSGDKKKGKKGKKSKQIDTAAQNANTETATAKRSSTQTSTKANVASKTKTTKTNASAKAETSANTSDGAEVGHESSSRTTAVPKSKKQGRGKNKPEPTKDEKVEAKEEIPLPSWIPSLSGAAYAMYSQAGVHTLKMGRKNADTLVGLPSSSQSLDRNYMAAETKVVDFKSLRFIKRPAFKQWCMQVKGFVLDRVGETQPSSQGGAIPRSWAKAGGWTDVPDSDPPNEFWRTLVADRGRDGRNPPVYYSRACKESFSKGGLSSGSVNTTDLINNERCSVVAQFCRRVQAVIWNRSLIKTKTGKLGLAAQNVHQGDFICVLYGCSVPVVLRRVPKTKSEVEREAAEDVAQWCVRWGTAIMRACKRRTRRRLKYNLGKLKHNEWVNATEEQREKLPFKEPKVNERLDLFMLQLKWLRRWGRNVGLKRYRTSPKQPTRSTVNDAGDATNGTRPVEENGTGHLEGTGTGLTEEIGPGPTQMSGSEPTEENGIAHAEASGPGVAESSSPDLAKASSLGSAEENGNSSSTQTETETATATATTKTPKGRRKFFVSTEHSYPASKAYLGPLEKKMLARFKTNSADELKEPDWKANKPVRLDQGDVKANGEAKKEKNQDRKQDAERLRLEENWCYYVLLGECYVHGMMDGEAMAYQNLNSIPAQVFELR